MIDDQLGSFASDERSAIHRTDRCDDEAVVQASLDRAHEDLVRAAVEAGPGPYAVSCSRIDRAFDHRMAPHRHLTWARLLAERLKMQLKLDLHRHASSSGTAGEPQGSQFADLATTNL